MRCRRLLHTGLERELIWRSDGARSLRVQASACVLGTTQSAYLLYPGLLGGAYLHERLWLHHGLVESLGLEAVV